MHDRLAASLALVLAAACGGRDGDDDDAAPDAGRGADAGGDAGADADVDAGGGADAGADGGPACDADGDGAQAVACGGDDCDDGDADVRPGMDDGPRIERIDTGAFASVLVDTSGYEPGGLAVHPEGWATVAYADGYEVVRHATNAGGTWEVEVVREDAGLDATLALDVAGVSHVAYRVDHSTFYASNGSGAWEVVSVPTYLPTLSLAIAADADGNPGIAYDTTNMISREIGWTAPVDGAWAAETTGEPAESPPEVALGADGTPFICFTNGGAARVVFRDELGWTAESAGNGRCSGIAIAPDGTVYVTTTTGSQFEPGPLTLYARVGDGAWEPDEVATDVILQAPVAAGPDGSVHVAYRQQGDAVTTLQVATFDGAQWRSAVVAEPDEEHRLGGPAIAVDATGIIHVTFLTIPTAHDADEDAVELRYARFAPPDTVDDDCDGTAW